MKTRHAPPVQNFKLVLEYDGAKFFGFQLQPHHRTVQQVLEEALSRLFDQKVKIKSASGRTDSGVHAEHQVVNFLTATMMTPSQILRGLNRYLPRDASARTVQQVPLDFHARYSAKSKTYEYRIWNDPVRSPLRAARFTHVPYPLDLEKMREGAQKLTGRHDFRSFCSSGGLGEDGRKDTVRTVRRFDIQKRKKQLILKVEADGFLYHMVRNMAGILLELGRGKISLQDLSRILNSGDKPFSRVTAPAHGLTLIDVTY